MALRIVWGLWFFCTTPKALLILLLLLLLLLLLFIVIFYYHCLLPSNGNEQFDLHVHYHVPHLSLAVLAYSFLGDLQKFYTDDVPVPCSG